MTVVASVDKNNLFVVGYVLDMYTLVVSGLVLVLKSTLWLSCSSSQPLS